MIIEFEEHSNYGKYSISRAKFISKLKRDFT